jgi:hypothetical protein
MPRRRPQTSRIVKHQQPHRRPALRRPLFASDNQQLQLGFHSPLELVEYERLGFMGQHVGGNPLLVGESPADTSKKLSAYAANARPLAGHRPTIPVFLFDQSGEDLDLVWLERSELVR